MSSGCVKTNRVSPIMDDGSDNESAPPEPAGEVVGAADLLEESDHGYCVCCCD